MGSITFEGVKDEYIRKTFLAVLKRYDKLQDCNIVLKQRRIKATTMQAQPVIRLKDLFVGPDTYKIKLALYVRDSQNLKVSDLPEPVLTGWFAHELGHVCDYAPHSTFHMIRYGLKYFFSDRFKREVEHRADQIAIDIGFHDEILATKRFVFENDLIEDGYKDQMRKYYMSIADVEMCIKDKQPMQPAWS